MYRTLIIEDEHHLREALSILLEIVAPDRIQIIGYAENADDAVKIIDRLAPDLVFMDIMLKRGTGFDVLHQITHKRFHLIFTTAYEEHAIRAFKFNAIDYLLKPIDAEELQKSIARIAERQQQFVLETQLLQIPSDPKKMPERIVLPTQEAMHVVKIEDIIRCETSGSYTTFFLTQDRKIIVSKALKQFEEILTPPYFLRVHQSHLINIHYIISYSREGTVQMHDNISIPISRSNKDAFFKLMKEGG
jgi:two-component system LytT family response regulator